jgi:hypothetical protein
MVSFDRWQSFDIQNELKSVGIKTETVSVAKKHYEDMAMLVYEERLAMPAIELLFEELTELKIMRGNRVDHPRKSSKDLADAVCGAIFGAISHTIKDSNQMVEIHTFRDRKPTEEMHEFDKRSIIEKNKPDQKDLDAYFKQFNINIM